MTFMTLIRPAYTRLVCIVALAAVALQVQAQQPVVASMGPQQIRAAELKRIIDAQPPEVRRQLSTDLGALDRLVRSELVRQAILAEARQKKWTRGLTCSC